MVANTMQMHGCPPPNECSEFDMVIDEQEIQGGYFQFQLRASRRAGVSEFLIDWGDGSSGMSSSYMLWHNYRAAGKYRVRLGKGVSWWRLWSGVTVTSDRRYVTSCPAIFVVCWSDWLESCQGTYCGWNSSLHNGGVQGSPPRWGRSLTSTYCCFQACISLEGPFPRWTEKITSLEGTFDGCKKMRGRIPKWPHGITEVTQCFRKTLAYGPVPEWTGNITTFDNCYADCTELTGSVPAWPAKAAEFSSVYSGCTGLTGEIPEWPASASCLISAYKGCTGLTGIIPPWPESVAYVNECYRGCTGLTGVWTTDPALLMPEEKLTEGSYVHTDNAVAETSDAVRQWFWDVKWGGLIPRPTDDGEDT